MAGPRRHADPERAVPADRPRDGLTARAGHVGKTTEALDFTSRL